MEVRKKRNIIITIVIAIVAMAIVGLVFYTTNHTQVDKTENVAKKAPKESINKKLDKLSIKDVAGLVITYSHLKFKKNDNWNEVYKTALDDGIKIQKYQKYQFDNYTVSAGSKNNYVYVINKKVVFTISNTKAKSKALISLGDDSKELGNYHLKTIYKTIESDPDAKKDFQDIKHNIDIDSDVSTQEEKTATVTRDDDAPKKNDDDSPSLFTAPSNLYGTWYAVSNGDEDEGKVFKITFGPHTLTNDFDDDGPQTLSLYNAADRKGDPLKWSQDYIKKTSTWLAVMNYENGIHTRTWSSTAGAGAYYFTKTEAGQPVLVEAGGAGVWVTYVYWKTPELAQEHKDDKFDDLNY